MCAKKSATVITSAYDRARGKLDTGDIILFSGKSYVSAAIKWMTTSRWSHVGMALRVPDFDFVLLWESTMLSDVSEYDSSKLVRGVRLVVLSECISKYNADIAVRRLTVNRTPKMRRDLANFRNEVRGRPYEESKMELIKAAYDGPFGRNEEDLSSLFCSELIAESYQVMGLLPKNRSAPNYKPSNEYTPADFASTDPKTLPLSKGSLSKPVFLKRAK